MPTADLDAIVAAARRGELDFTDHYLHERMGIEGRPWYSEVIFGLAHGRPRVIDDDRASATREAPSAQSPARRPTAPA